MISARTMLVVAALTAAAAVPIRSAAHEGARALNERIGFDQKIGAPLPLETRFRDSAGREVRLGDVLDGKPAVLELAWFSCGELCPITLRNLAGALRRVPFTPGRDFSVITLSIDPREGPKDAAGARALLRAAYGRGGGDGWYALTGAAPAIDALARAVGFRYVYDTDRDEYAHPAGVVVVDGSGRISHYLFGLEFAARDLKLALIDAGRGVLGSPIDRLVLRCHGIDPTTGQYTLAVMTIVDIAAGITVSILAAFVVLWLVRESRNRRRRGAA